jgi:RNA-directed DNA polymerase
MLVDKVASSLGLKPPYIELVALTASHRYKTYQIPKKTGGFRTINHPARELKLLQRWLVKNVLEKFPVHRNASAYKKTANTLLNASFHKDNNYLLKVDFQDFFPSITGSDVARLLRGIPKPLRRGFLKQADIEFVRRIVCRNDRLTIGAPSSPLLSNLVMFKFDEYWSSYCQKRDVVYSRYADDLYFSTKERGLLEGVLADLRRDLNTRTSPNLQINEAKTVFTSRKRRRLVTGLVLTPDGNVSLGRHRKRYIKSLVFKSLHDKLSPSELSSLAGLLAFARSVEPSFLDSLRRKYGAKSIGEG